jgi:sulfatase modifying factor 1
MTSEPFTNKSCCHLSRPLTAVRGTPANHFPHRTHLREGLATMESIPGGFVYLGGDDEIGYTADGEGPARQVQLSAYRLDATAVTNSQFLHFVEATEYKTDAEHFGWSYVFYALVHPQALADVQQHAAVALAPWWVPVHGANWHEPFGPGSNIADLLDHPVVHVSWNDASAFAAWAGKSLPTEAQWERAARGGLISCTYPWGNNLIPDGKHRCNLWQGKFPQDNTGEDGYLGTAPARSFEPNDYGLYNMVGNVWEWCADWWSPTWHTPDTQQTRTNPLGPLSGKDRVIRGGSYLCHASHCHRYRLSARSFNTPDSSTGHMGFRCCATA